LSTSCPTLNAADGTTAEGLSRCMSRSLPDKLETETVFGSIGSVGGYFSESRNRGKKKKSGAAKLEVPPIPSTPPPSAELSQRHSPVSERLLHWSR